MKRNAWILSLAVAAWSACSGGQPAQESKKAGAAPDRIQGKAQVLMEPTVAADAGLNAGGSSVYLWEGTRRYRLFLRTPADIVHGKEYVAEGIYAQKAIDEIGDPDQGRNGYPLPSSCERVVNMAWKGLPMDVSDGYASLLRNRVKRYPARPLFLVMRIQPAEGGTDTADTQQKEDEDQNVPEVSVPADKQRAFLQEGPTVQTAPLWEPAGGTVRCKVVIGPNGKISELETGEQLCESVPWDRFRYQAPVEHGHPVKVKTEVEVRFEPRKAS